MKKKLFYFVIFFLLLFIVCLIVSFIFDNKYDKTIKEGNFNYEDSITDELIESKYYYSDSYFNDISTKDNEHLRTFSMTLALTFKPTYREDNVNINIQNIYDGIGIKDTKYYDDEIFNKDTIGTSLGHKKLNNRYELVVLVIRGAGYEDEWISNFKLGSSDNAEGFDDASKIVLSRLKTYIEDNNIKKYKLLVVGYSRGGAVANIVGTNLNNDNSYHIDRNDLYVYTFDGARGSSNDKLYKNIHNVVNNNDIITHFYPEKWGLYNNGVVYDITDNNRTIKSKCLNILSNDKIINGNNVNKEEFLTSLISMLPDNREEYDKISNSIINLYILVNTKSIDELGEIINFISNNKTNIGSMDIIALLNSNDEKKIKEVYDKITINYDKKYNKISKVLSKEEYNNLKEDIYKLFIFFKPMLKKDLGYSINNNTCSMYHTMTLIYNFDKIIEEHTFSNIYDLIKSKDSYYK